LVSHTKGRIQIMGAGEQGAKYNNRTYKGGSGGRLEKNAW